MKTSVIIISIGSFLTLGMMPAAIAQQSIIEPQDPSIGGQQNSCWGNAASQTAKLSTPDGTSGGGMGQHSRSTQAANQNGGFASSDNAFGITFNDNAGEGSNGRLGVGNASRSQPHQTQPGDGGNGVHAQNNINFSNTIDPVTGQLGNANALESCP